MNVSGVGCYKVTSQVSGYEDKYIILPDYQNYWSSSLDASDVCDAMSYSASLYSGYGSRMDALFIRPVYDESLEPANPSGPEPDVEFAWIPMCKYGEKTLYVANKNLGAARPSDPGKYYMWGDVTGHLYGDDFYFGVQNYPLAVGSDKYSVYVYSEEPGRWGGAGDAPDNLVQLQPAHDAATAELLRTEVETLKAALRAESVEIVSDGAERAMPGKLGALGTVYLSLEGLVDKAAEAKRIAAELAKLAGFIKAGEAKLANTQFTEHAPAQIVETARRQLADNKAKVAQLEKLARLFA